ncbi:MAG: hypothetical protein K6F73_06245 [Lachnospiraceae bacterium]|nr:hypothetical protein [Lachnospiraceae bacterium]
MGDTMSAFSDSCMNILGYAGVPDANKEKIYSKIKEFAAMEDQSAPDDAARRLRKELGSYFYELYKLVFFKTLEDRHIPEEIFMFLYFGYIDEELAGEENTQILHDLAVSIGHDEEMRVFTFYQWLRLIYSCKKDPSIDDFSTDYITTLRKRKRDGEITDQQEREALEDGEARVKFEIDNMFRSASKMLSSRVTTFVPFFSGQTLTKPLDKSLLSYATVNKMLSIVKGIDFSLFYRQTVYTAPELGLDKTFIQVEVLPDIILMPLVGTRGAMWQEITGAKRTTPGRFLLPIAEEEDLSGVLIKMCAEFRWELCKRIQGARWNDLSERSLTSDYVDYIDTYRKNRDLSTEAKERIKAAMVKHRKSYKEMFIADYMTYIMYESSGALRHNKVVRAILFNYCPFSKIIREGAIATNPQYVQLIERFVHKTAHEQHLFDIATGRIEKAGNAIPPELMAHYEYLRM